MKRLSTILLLLIAYAIAAKADLHFPDFRFTHFTTENGLPSNRIRDIVQDNEGFIWFATKEAWNSVTYYTQRRIMSWAITTRENIVSG